MDLLLKLALECVHILAWPLFAIAYPLCASIQAIETNSNFDTEKLITYWVCFSLILLFENAIQPLLYSLPYWPYMKLTIVGCLVTPNFDGSFYIYNHLVRPCLSMNPRFVFNWLIKLLEILKQDNPLNEEKRESKETETEPLQNLISFKPVIKHPEVEQKDINAVEVTEKNGLSATKSVRQIEPDFALPRIATNARIVGGKDVPDLTASKKVQKECTCATSEAHLISQLQGRTHASEKIKPLERNVVSPPNSAKPGSETSDSKSSQELWSCVLCKANCTRKLDLISHFCGQRHAEALESLKATPNSKFCFKPWTCGICQVTLKNKNDLILHLQSKRHFDACENQKGKASSGSSEKNSSNLPGSETNVPDLTASKKVQKECTFATSEAHLISQLQGRTHASEKIKPLERNVVSPPNSAKPGSETSDSKSSQELWSCVLCKANCTRKLDLISHFCGQRHAEALESLKATPNSKFNFKPWTCGICQVTLKNKNDLILHLQSKRHFDACENQKGKASSGSSEKNSSKLAGSETIYLKSRSVAEFRDYKLLCTICNVSCTGKQNMNAHLNGSKHLARTLELADASANGRLEMRKL